MPATVALARCPSYDPPLVQEALLRTLDLAGGLASFARKGDRVTWGFCCHELCPSGAVTEKPSAVKRLLARIRKRS
jgi:uncharacterized protein (DUF362 family)